MITINAGNVRIEVYQTLAYEYHDAFDGVVFTFFDEDGDCVFVVKVEGVIVGEITGVISPASRRLTERLKSHIEKAVKELPAYLRPLKYLLRLEGNKKEGSEE